MPKIQQHSGFDKVAGYYDRLVFFTSGNILKKARNHFVYGIPDNGSILILGGGTGDVLPELIKKGKGDEIYFLEPSPEMLRRAVEKSGSNKNISFINNEFGPCKFDRTFDTIYCNFFLDLFPDKTLKKNTDRIWNLLNPGASLICTDFNIPGTTLLKIPAILITRFLYIFFRVTTELDMKKLPPIFKVLEEKGFIEFRTKSYLWGLIRTTWYKKPEK